MDEVTGAADYGRLDEDELPEVARLVTHAFAGNPEGSADWLRAAGLENVRVLRDGGRPVASLMLVPMGQFFGGRSVPMMGVAGVAVAPEARGRGLARRLMGSALREMNTTGWAISCLYASTQTLYRQVGYEQAGHRFEIRIPLSQIDVRERGQPLVALSGEHIPAVESCYREFAADRDGWLDRGPYCWSRVRELRGEPFHGFGIGSEERLEGYLYLAQRRKPESWRHDVVITDLAFRSETAARRLLGLLADFGTVGDEVVLHGGPHHPLLWLLGQQRYTVALANYWMIRVTDPTRALEARGYPTGVETRVSFHLDDPLLGDDAGSYHLEVAGGTGRVERGGEGTVRLGVNAFAALWAGFLPPRELYRLGGIEGAASSIDALGAVFGGGAPPAMMEMF